MGSKSWLFWAAGSAIAAACTSILAKAGVAKVNPDQALLVRTLVIAVLLAGFVTTTGKIQSLIQLPLSALGFLSLSAVGTCVSWICYFRALKLGEASKVDPVDKSSVVLVAIFAFAFLGERLAPLQWLGVILVGAGVILLALKS